MRFEATPYQQRGAKADIAWSGQTPNGQTLLGVGSSIDFVSVVAGSSAKKLP